MSTYIKVQGSAVLTNLKVATSADGGGGGGGGSYSLTMTDIGNGNSLSYTYTINDPNRSNQSLYLHNSTQGTDVEPIILDANGYGSNGGGNTYNVGTYGNITFQIRTQSNGSGEVLQTCTTSILQQGLYSGVYYIQGNATDLNLDGSGLYNNTVYLNGVSATNENILIVGTGNGTINVANNNYVNNPQGIVQARMYIGNPGTFGGQIPSTVNAVFENYSTSYDEYNNINYNLDPYPITIGGNSFGSFGTNNYVSGIGSVPVYNGPSNVSWNGNISSDTGNTYNTNLLAGIFQDNYFLYLDVAGATLDPGQKIEQNGWYVVLQPNSLA